MPLEGTGCGLCACADLSIKNSDHYKLLKTVMQKCLQSGNCKKFFTAQSTYTFRFHSQLQNATHCKYNHGENEWILDPRNFFGSAFVRRKEKKKRSYMQTEQKNTYPIFFGKNLCIHKQLSETILKKSCFDGFILYINLTEGKHCTFT